MAKQINVSDLFKIHISKCEATWDIDPEQFPQAIHDYVWDYGMRQCLNDATSNVIWDSLLPDGTPRLDDDDIPIGFHQRGESREAYQAAALAAAESRFEQLKNGEVPAGGGGKRLDPLFSQVRETLAKVCGVKATDLKTWEDVDQRFLARATIMLTREAEANDGPKPKQEDIAEKVEALKKQQVDMAQGILDMQAEAAEAMRPAPVAVKETA